ncbi:hypothetical protein Ddye_009888 [Dipteronia dyeriana]|uniref:Protein kinase domain-containing protein n=1 Tax=Dipteronia dyeriana TaxID=168575 RepID=A0AAD9XC62_9ROSI|nr:hypothetical protein Ddye_009888 [Dipteronia dyeriana]
MDAQMEGQYPSEAALQAAQLSLKCLEWDPRGRPSMKEVVEVVQLSLRCLELDLRSSPSMKEVMEVLKELEALASCLHEKVNGIIIATYSLEFSTPVQKVNVQRLFKKAEVNILGSHNHPNLIRLLGYCREDEKFLLIYELMQNGSLDTHLSKKIVPLNHYLGIYGLKLLLEQLKNYNVKLSNLSLAMRGPSNEESHVTTSFAGKFEYTAPEYVNEGHLYIKSDVYGFGVMLVELLSGLKTDNKKHSMGYVVERSEPYLSLKRNLKTIMDVDMEGQYSNKGAFQVVQLTKKCLDFDPENRPSMKEVVEVLKQIEAMEKETDSSKN